MKIVLAPDKFKGSLTAPQVCGALAAGLRRVDASIAIDECPVADGGEGTVEALVAATGGRFDHASVTGPRSDMRVDARFGFLGTRNRKREPGGSAAGLGASGDVTAVIEMSAASGLALLAATDRD